VTGNDRLGLILLHSNARQAFPYGLLLYRPGITTRVAGTLLYHPEQALARTAAVVIVDGLRYRPTFESLRVEWTEPVESGVIAVRWSAGALEVEEQFTVEDETLVRSIRVRANGATPAHCEIQVELALYANPLLFSRFTSGTHSLRASGYEAIALSTRPAGRTFERFITVSVPVGEAVVARYSVDRAGKREGGNTGEGGSSEHATAAFAPQTSPDPIARQCAIARTGLRAAVSSEGRFLASLMQYEFAWGLDAAMVASGAAMLGEGELAARVLRYTLDHLVNDAGMVAEADRFREGELAELNGNGALLRAVLDVAEWTRNFDLIGSRWDRITAVAEYLLRPEFQHESGLLVNRRDFWERTPWMGVQRGAELGHQVFAVVGLRAAARLAGRFGTPEQQRRWSEAAAQIEEATLNSPTHRLVDSGFFIKRRGSDGAPQRNIAPDTGWFSADYAPYLPPESAEGSGPIPWEPDAVTALPLVYGLVDPTSSTALDTLDRLEALWSPSLGGYGRYNPAADIDSPGPWPFATMWVAAAQLEAGRIEDAARSIRWLLEVAAPGGAWPEFIGERATPPFPPVGIIVWAWAQWGVLTVRHMLGACIEGETLIVAPRIAGIALPLRVGNARLEIMVEGMERATLDGRPIPMEHGSVRLSLPFSNGSTLRFT